MYLSAYDCSAHNTLNVMQVELTQSKQLWKCKWFATISPPWAVDDVIVMARVPVPTPESSVTCTVEPLGTDGRSCRYPPTVLASAMADSCMGSGRGGEHFKPYYSGS